METYMGRLGMPPLILILGTRWRGLGSFTSRPLCPRNLTVRRINPVTQSGDKPLPHMPLWRGAEWSIGLWKRSGYWCCIRINSKWWSWKVLPSVGSIPHYEEVGLCVGIIIICIVSAMCFAVLDCWLRKGRWASVVRGSSGMVGVLAAKTVIFFQICVC